MMAKSSRLIVAVRSDTHGNHRFGLINPDTVFLYEDGHGGSSTERPKLLQTQEHLWEMAEEDRKAVAKLAGKDPIILFDLGDMGQGAANGFGNGKELVSTRPADEIRIATANYEPWLRMANVQHVRFFKGTAYHEGGQGSLAMTVADLLAARHGKDVQAQYHALDTVGGITFDLAHHGPPPGIREWIRGNVLELYTRSLMMGELLAGREPPQVILRGHYHQFATRVVSVILATRTIETRAAILPSYCMIDDYARKVARSPSQVVIGMLAYEIIDGRLVAQHELRRTIDFRTMEVIG